MKSKPLSPPPAICGSNIIAREGSFFRLLEGEEISAIYTTSQSTAANLLSQPCCGGGMNRL